MWRRNCNWTRDPRHPSSRDQSTALSKPSRDTDSSVSTEDFPCFSTDPSRSLPSGCLIVHFYRTYRHNFQIRNLWVSQVKSSWRPWQPDSSNATSLWSRSWSFRSRVRSHSDGDRQGEVHSRSRTPAAKVQGICARSWLHRQVGRTWRHLQGSDGDDGEAGIQPGDPILRDGDPQGLVPWRRQHEADLEAAGRTYGSHRGSSFGVRKHSNRRR